MNRVAETARQPRPRAPAFFQPCHPPSSGSDLPELMAKSWRSEIKGYAKRCARCPVLLRRGFQRMWSTRRYATQRISIKADHFRFPSTRNETQQPMDLQCGIHWTCRAGSLTRPRAHQLTRIHGQVLGRRRRKRKGSMTRAHITKSRSVPVAGRSAACRRRRTA